MLFGQLLCKGKILMDTMWTYGCHLVSPSEHVHIFTHGFKSVVSGVFM